MLCLLAACPSDYAATAAPLLLALARAGWRYTSISMSSMDVESAENPAFNGGDAPKNILDSASSALQSFSNVESAVAATLAEHPSLEVAPATAPSAETKFR